MVYLDKGDAVVIASSGAEVPRGEPGNPVGRRFSCDVLTELASILPSTGVGVDRPFQSVVVAGNQCKDPASRLLWAYLPGPIGGHHVVISSRDPGQVRVERSVHALSFGPLPPVIAVWPRSLTLGLVTFQLAHFSDTHIGYEAYKAVSASGENQRAVDVARAFVNTVSDIIETDPPLVVHSGDLADRTVIPIRLILLIRQQLQRLASIRPDGSRRQVVLIAGNHEIPRSRKEACFLHLFEGIPGVQVVTRDYETVVFDGTGATENHPACLSEVTLHALPHDALKTVDFDVVHPVPGRVNVLVAHGVAGGSDLYLRSLGREFTIPTEVLARPWEYVALGHWHKQGPVPLVSLGSSADATDRGRVWYAGSTENMGFGDLRENGTRRGWLRVTVNPSAEPTVERRHLPIRSMQRLPVLDAASLTPEEITATLLERLRAVDIAGVVLGQVVEGVSRDVWSLVDLPQVRAAAANALHYEVTVRPRKADPAGDVASPAETRGLGDAEIVLQERALVVLADHERTSGLQMAKDLLRAELEKGFSAKEKPAENAEGAPPPAETEGLTPVSTGGQL